MNNITKLCNIGLVILYLISTAACTTTQIVDRHPLFIQSNNESYANVYILRPDTQRTRGIADNPVTIELDKIKISELARGEYILVKIKPTTTDFIVRSLAYVTGKTMPETVWRARRFTFDANKTYFVVPRFQQQEWRGIYFIPELVSLEEASRLAADLKPAGQLAKKEPIAKP